MQALMLLLNSRSLILVVISSLLHGLLCFPADAKNSGRTTFVLDGTGNMIFEGDATAVRSETVLMLTNASRFSMGRVLYSTPVRMKPPNQDGTVYSFKTNFLFTIYAPPFGPNGDGLAFLMTPSKSMAGAAVGEYLGLTVNPSPSNSFFAVEFDTLKNEKFHDPDDNHVGVDLNSLESVAVKSAGFFNILNEYEALNFTLGRGVQAWIDYDHPRTQLNVSIIYAGFPRPSKPLISIDLNLSAFLEEEMYVGFSAATGEFVEMHYVVSWSFTNDDRLPSMETTVAHESKNGRPRGLSVFMVIVITVSVVMASALTGAGTWTWVRRRRRRCREEAVEKWELEYWPHRFHYKDLSVATKGFGQEQLLGHGGFGRVYRGVLPDSGVDVAVKCIIGEFTEGMKGFVAEISSMGRMQHRNLVKLRGWCRRNKELFLVYDYMPNGSLDKLIFDNPKAVLPWSHRYNILKGVAAGLLYLHEQWEKRVVHRDVKSSNVLLDSELNGRLGDFGLAKLYDHSENPQTTHVVGTLGYIAPELIQTGKVTPSSDVYSFGALLMEVACGRKPVDPSMDTDRVVLVEWVSELYANERLLDAADPKLQGNYDVEEMERVLKLGLFCSHPEDVSRPSIRYVCQILVGETSFPDVDMTSLDATVMTPAALLPTKSRSMVSFARVKAPVEGSKYKQIYASDHSFSCGTSCDHINSAENIESPGSDGLFASTASESATLSSRSSMHMNSIGLIYSR
ncbi:L-type lectin-domain containing receptor kinase SIT2-like [Cryptomeria japonica]|uniref:L-type lectin-domain containing receptor kinase SIT2-like n=1 Tax=Cryptomeria japonica TaxID=3369 RepID=UPI0027D9D6DA|nr:L-type lectin-domain containing receptor kinase SIT2-like [Cryptomeria japonica]